MMITYPLVAISSRLQVQRNDQTGNDNYKVKEKRTTEFRIISVSIHLCVYVTLVRIHWMPFLKS